MLLKKYANRRLYDTGASKYVTLEEIAERIRTGEEALVIDAATGADLTQTTLTQIILESRGASKLLPVPLLHHLIRLGDDSLGEFFSRWIAWALEVYVGGKQANQWVSQWNPLMGLFQNAQPSWPWGAGQQQNPYAQPNPYPQAPGYGGNNPYGMGFPNPWGQPQGPGAGPQMPMPPAPPASSPSAAPANMQPGPPPPPGSPGSGGADAGSGSEEIARLQRELEAIRAGLAGRKRGPRKKDGAAKE